MSWEPYNAWKKLLGRFVYINNGEFSNINVTNVQDLASLVDSTVQIALELNIPGTLDTTSTTALESITEFPALWTLEDAILTEVKSKVITAVSTGTEPSLNIVLGGVNALSSSLFVNETIATGTIDTDNRTITNGDSLEINFSAGNADAVSLIVYLTLKFI